MPNLVNQLTVKEYEASFKDAEGFVVAAFDGLTVLESETLRCQLEERGAGFRMVRTKLARRVLADKGYEFPAEALEGSTAIAYGNAEAAIGAAKILTGPEVKKAGKVKLKAGMLEGKVLDSNEAVALADVPDRNTLNAMFLGALQGPGRGLVGMLQAPYGSLLRVLQARIDSEGGAE